MNHAIAKVKRSCTAAARAAAKSAHSSQNFAVGRSSVPHVAQALTASDTGVMRAPPIQNLDPVKISIEDRELAIRSDEVSAEQRWNMSADNHRGMGVT
jgi:hypothetical protein